MGTWSAAAGELAPLFADGRFELRFALGGGAAVRTYGGPVAPGHAEAPDPPAPWSARADCGEAAGWVLAPAAPADPARARAVLQRAVERHAALRLQTLAADRAALTAELLDRLTHRLRTDVTTLQTVAEGLAAGLFEAGELAQLPSELARTGTEAQRSLSAAREAVAALAPAARRDPEPLLETLGRELAAAGVEQRPPAIAGERPMALVPGPGWGACARLLAADERLAGGLTVAADPRGWAVAAGRPGEAEPLAWTQAALGELFHAGLIVVAGGGSAAAAAPAGGGLRVELVVPAGPSC